MKVFLVSDIEGVAGVVSHETQSYPTGRYYDQACHLLTMEINAAIDGLVAAGADEVVVLDGHGPGAVVFEELHARASLIHGRPITFEQMFQPLASCDVVVVVGQHAMHGIADGNQAHTFDSTSIDWIRLNGRPAGEIAFIALLAGLQGIPVIALSGDRAACIEAEEWVPAITTVAVKQGLGRNAAVSLSATAAREAIQAGMRDALRKHRDKPVQPITLTPANDPAASAFIREQRFLHSDAADAAEARGAQRVDSQTVRWTSERLEPLLINH